MRTQLTTLKENNLNPRPSPTPRPFNKEENDRLLNHPTGYPEIDAKLREVFRDKYIEGLGEDEFVKVWHSDIKYQYFKTAKEIKDFLAKAQENPFKLPTSFEALKKGVIDSLNSHEKEMSYGGTKALKYDLRKIDKDLHIGLDIEEEWARDGDKKWSEYRKSLVDSRNYTPEQKSRILAAFDGYLKEKIEKPIDFKYASLGVPSVWSGRLDEAIRGPKPTPTPTPKPTPTATPRPN